MSTYCQGDTNENNNEITERKNTFIRKARVLKGFLKCQLEMQESWIYVQTLWKFHSTEGSKAQKCF